MSTYCQGVMREPHEVIAGYALGNGLVACEPCVVRAISEAHVRPRPISEALHAAWHAPRHLVVAECRWCA